MTTITVDAEKLAELQATVAKLAAWKNRMSYNDSYFGEPAGLLKALVYELDRAPVLQGLPRRGEPVG